MRFEERFREQFEEGARKALLRGRQEGEARLLHRVLRKRFGDLPPWVWPRLQEAQPERLEQWSERLLDAESLEAMFDGE